MKESREGMFSSVSPDGDGSSWTCFRPWVKKEDGCTRSAVEGVMGECEPLEAENRILESWTVLARMSS